MKLLLLPFAALVALPAAAQPGSEVLYELASPSPENFGAFGFALAALPDVTGDGRPDLIAGARQEDAGTTDAGRVYVLSGVSGDLLHTLASPNPEAGGDFGVALAGTGGTFHVVVVGAPAENVGTTAAGVNAGRAYVFDGTGALVYTFSLPEPLQLNAGFGASVADAGDVNADGAHDYLIGTAGADKAYVFSAGDGALLRTYAPPACCVFFGQAVANAGDVDVDGTDDHLVGAPSEAFGGVSRSGRAYRYSGATGALLGAFDPPTPEVDGFFGRALGCAGDLSGDGVPDLVIGAPDEDGGGAEGAGRAYVFSGAGGLPLHALTSPRFEEDGAFGSAVSGLAGPGGCNAESAGFAVGAYAESAGAGLFDAGRAYVYRADGTLEASLQSTEPATNGWFGVGLAGLGDLDGDGGPELALGAPYEVCCGGANAGRVSVRSFPSVVAAEPSAEGPVAAVLHTPAPNPTRGTTRIAFDLPAPGPVRLAVYDALGREVARLVDEERAAGGYEVRFEAPSLPAGTYLVRLDAGGHALTRLLTRTR